MASSGEHDEEYYDLNALPTCKLTTSYYGEPIDTRLATDLRGVILTGITGEDSKLRKDLYETIMILVENGVNFCKQDTGRCESVSTSLTSPIGSTRGVFKRGVCEQKTSKGEQCKNGISEKCFQLGIPTCSSHMSIYLASRGGVPPQSSPVLSPGSGTSVPLSVGSQPSVTSIPPMVVKVLCHGKTTKGVPCQRPPSKGCLYCSSHTGQGTAVVSQSVQ